MIELDTENYSEEGERPQDSTSLLCFLKSGGDFMLSAGLGTSGDFSALVSRTLYCWRSPQVASTTACSHLATFDRLMATGNRLKGVRRPLAEALLYLMVVRARGARAVLHMHSVRRNLVSELNAHSNDTAAQWYES